MSKIVLNEVTNSNNLSNINSNFDKIEDALNNKVFYRDNPVGEPNEIKQDVDFNAKNALNVGQMNVASLKINGVLVEPSSVVVVSALKIVNNLNDVASPSAALANIGGVTALQAANAAPVQSVAGKTGTVTLVKADVGLGNVDNTSDVNKPVSTATTTALNLKANIAGVNFTGDVGIFKASPSFVLDNSAVTNRLIFFRTNGLSRFQIATDSTAEGGGNAGSNFSITRFNDAGSSIDSPLTITRSSGQVAITTLSVSGNASVTGTFSTTGAYTPNQTAGIVGTTTNNNANAGSIGELIESEVLVGSAVSLTSGVAANITSISLTAGDWDIFGLAVFVPAGTTTTSLQVAGSNTTSATLPTAPNKGGYGLIAPVTGGGLANNSIPFQRRQTFASTTTVFLVAQANFATSTQTAYGYIGARRRR